jgi:hypothetical protein
MTENTSLLNVIVLVVLAQGMSLWWGAETPYSGALDMTPEGLQKFNRISATATVSFGLVASVLTKRLTPVLASVIFSVAMTALYRHEYAKAKGVSSE